LRAALRIHFSEDPAIKQILKKHTFQIKGK